MIYIAHRINTVLDLKKVSPNYGIEIDLRDRNDRIILSHDPFGDGEDFNQFIRYYNHAFLILNIKSEGIEPNIIKILRKHNIQEYFFLDSSFPLIYRLMNDGEKNIAIRFSELESIETIKNFYGKVKWIWIDTITNLPIKHHDFQILKTGGFKLCLVSPDLCGREYDILEYKSYLINNKIEFDAICTKRHNINKWK